MFRSKQAIELKYTAPFIDPAPGTEENAGLARETGVFFSFGTSGYPDRVEIGFL